jgi:nucleolar protein 15
MPDLRPRKQSYAKPAPKEKTSSKRKVATNDDASPIAPKKLKGDVKPKITGRSAPITDRQEEQPTADDETLSLDGDDEAQALANTIDSDNDEADEADEADGASPDEEIKDLELPKVPKGAAKVSESEDSESGVVYIGRIPRGFYENQMREYFSQFGQVNKIRMSRNKATGQSKHFAFIEFAEVGVAEIVAKTMDNYLLAGHILKVKMVAKSQMHEKLWIGANKRFKKIPWNKMAGNKLKKPLAESAWTERISKEQTKRGKRAKKLLEIGYEFEAPELKAVHDTDDSTPTLEAAKDDAPKAIEAVPEADEADIAQPAPVAKTTKGDKKQPAKTGKKGKKAKKAAS